jgi:hypothetical protein
VRIDRQPGSAARPVRTVVVEVSHDDGATWRRVPFTGHGQEGQATVRHPAGPGFVSLRGRATDAAGNTVTVTVIRAYWIA